MSTRKFIKDYVEELVLTGDDAFQLANCWPVLMGVGLLGDPTDVKRRGMRRTHSFSAYTVAVTRLTASLLDRIWPLRPTGSGTTATIDIGSSADNDITIPDFTISASHCRFAHSAEGGLTVMDRESLNGTLVNGERIEANVSCRVEDQSTVIVGRIELRVLHAESFHRLVASRLST